MKKNIMKLYYLSVATAMTVTSLSSYPQDGLDQSALVLEEILVTAQKREQSLQDAPISIAAFSANELEKLGIHDLLNFAHSVPNLDIRQTTNGSAGTRIYIRGVGVNDHVVTLDGAVGLYMDGVYMARNSGMAFELADPERIEVLRGPQGSLWGRNTAGGAIHIVNKKPAGEFRIEQDVTAGDYDLFRTKTHIDFPQVGKLSSKLSLLYSENEGWVENKSAGANWGEKESYGARLALQWAASDSAIVDYAFDYSKADFGNTYYQVGTPFANPAFAGVPFSTSRLDEARPGVPYRESDYKIQGHNLTLTWDLHADLKFVSITGYRDMEQSNYTDSGANPVSPRIFANDPFDSEQDQFSQEFQFVGQAFGEAVDYTFGLYYFTEDGSEFNQDYITLSTPDLALAEIKLANRTLSAKNTAQAAFGQVTWTPDWLDNRLHLTAGGRYSWDERKMDLVSDSGLSAQPSEDWNDFSPSFIVAYDVASDSTVYFKRIKGYRTGGFNGRAASLVGALTPVDEESITSIEFGLKSEWFDRRLRLNAAFYDSEYDDIQVLIYEPDVPGSILQFNAGKGEMSGVEIDFSAILAEGLALRGAYSYLDSEFKEVIDPFSGEDLTDDFVLVAAPKHSYTLNVEYSFPALSWGVPSFALDYSWKDERFFATRVSDGADPLESFGVWNGRFMVGQIPVGTNATLDLSVWGRNLTDKEFQLDGFRLATCGCSLLTYGEPQSFGVTAVYRFQ